MNFSKTQLDLLSSFVKLLTSNPQLIHLPELKFFKEWLISINATIPAQTEANNKHEAPKSSPTMHDSPNTPMDVEASSSEEEPELVESDFEVDLEGVIKDEEIPSQDMGTVHEEGVELSEEQQDEFDLKRSEGQKFLSEGNFESAIQSFTDCLKISGDCAPVFVKRATAYLKLNRVNAAIKDADRAIELNPDSGAAYRIRGLSHKLLGHWEKAFTDLSTSNKIDFSEEAVEAMKEIEPKARRVQEHSRRYQRQLEERELKARQRRVKKARESYERAKKAGCCSNDAAGSCGSAAGFNPSNLFGDPELMAMMQDPEVMTALNEIMTDQSKMSKYANNPKVKKVMEKMQQTFASGGGAAGGLGGMFAGMAGAGKPTSPSSDDLD